MAHVFRFLQSEDGLLSTATVIWLPLLLFAAAMAIDITSIEAEERYVQSQTNIAALSAIRNFTSADHAHASARHTIKVNRYSIPCRSRTSR